MIREGTKNPLQIKQDGNVDATNFPDWRGSYKNPF
jgi:hypothetical protein